MIFFTIGSLLSLSHAESEQPSFIAEESEGDLSPVAEDKNEVVC